MLTTDRKFVIWVALWLVLSWIYFLSGADAAIDFEGSGRGAAAGVTLVALVLLAARLWKR